MDHVAETAALLSINIRALVDDEDAVTVTPSISPGGGTVFTVRVKDKDAGKVIGVAGRTARALRVILAGIGKKHGQVYSLDIPGW